MHSATPRFDPLSIRAHADDRSGLWRARRIGLLALLSPLMAILACLPGAGEVDVAEGSALVVDMGGAYLEAPAPSLISQLAGDDTRPFLSLLSVLRLAERDDRLSSVVLRIRPLQIGWGKADELREAVERLGAAGRKTVALLEVQGIAPNKELYIASAADEIFVVPGSSTPLVGLAAEYIFLGGLMEEIGVEFEVARAGRYKSAVEHFTERTMSEDSRAMADSLLDDVYERFKLALAEGRGLDTAEIEAAIERGPIRSQQLEEIGLIDGERHLDVLLEELGGGVVRHGDYAGIDPEEIGFEPAGQFALVYGSGNVVQGEAGSSPLDASPVFASETASRAILEAAEDAEIDAIVLRIDSPGGSALAAELIWRAIERARALGKPVVASFSDVAASGGYYVASAADAIVSDPGTLTGSIGVYALRPTLGGLLDKVAIGVDSLTRGRHADYLLASEKMSEATHERLQNMVLDTYQLFLRRVADGRDLAVAEVDRVGQGRVWTGQQAYEVGLVDELGGLYAAVARAKGLAGMAEDADVYLVPYPPSQSFSELVFTALQSGIRTATRQPLEGSLLDWPEPIDRLVEMGRQLPAGAPLLIPPTLVEIR